MAFRQAAADHHFRCLDFGYQAGAIQKPIDPQWEWKFPSSLRLTIDLLRKDQLAQLEACLKRYRDLDAIPMDGVWTVRRFGE